MKGGRVFRTVLIGLGVAFAGMCASVANAQGTHGWQPLGLLRIRDMTPWGLPRLDMLPAHAVETAPGTVAIEANLSYQNTWARSGNVAEYLNARGPGRRALSPVDVQSILDLDGDAYLVDGEFGLIDLTLHYRLDDHVGLYATVPYVTFTGGLLDPVIERFHDQSGFGTAARDTVPENRWQIVADVGEARIVALEYPQSSLGDPVLGVRYALKPAPRRWNVVGEFAVKVPSRRQRFLVSTGEPDYGMQLSWQYFAARHAFYLSSSLVYYSSPDTRLSRDRWIPSLIAGWEHPVSRRVHVVVQAYASRSIVESTVLEELAATKLTATAALQWFHRGNVVRIGITENIAHFNNTPDIGVTVSFARLITR